MKTIFTILTLLFTLTVGAQNPSPPGGNLPPSTDPNGLQICRIACFAGCSPISPVCRDKRLNIIEEAIQESEFNENYSEIKFPFDNSTVNIVESKSLDLNTMHIVFKSKLSNETISAVITTVKSSDKKPIFSTITTFNLPKGQIVVDSDSMKLITANEVVEISLEDLSKNDFSEMDRFQRVYKDLVYESDFLEFNLILSEFNSEEKSMACAMASLGYASAVAGMAAVGYATFVTAGAAAFALAQATATLVTATYAVQVSCFGEPTHQN